MNCNKTFGDVSTTLLCTCSISGDVSLKVPVSLESKLDLKADSVLIDKQLDTKSLLGERSEGQEHITGINSALSAQLND